MLNEFGQEIPDDTPVVIHVPGIGQVTDIDEIRALIRAEFSRAAADAGEETFEEANDFDVDDDLFPVSPHEYREDTELADKEVLEAGDPTFPADPLEQPPTGKPVGGAPPAEGPPPPAPPSPVPPQ